MHHILGPHPRDLPPRVRAARNNLDESERNHCWAFMPRSTGFQVRASQGICSIAADLKMDSERDVNTTFAPYKSMSLVVEGRQDASSLQRSGNTPTTRVRRQQQPDRSLSRRTQSSVFIVTPSEPFRKTARLASDGRLSKRDRRFGGHR